jgi:hypothetical protein
MDGENTNDIYTAAQISQLAAKASNELDESEQSLSQVQTRYRNLTNRGAYFSDEAHKASFIEHEPLLAGAEDKAYAVAKRHETTMRRILQQLQSADRSNITDEELAKANLRAPFVKEDVERATLPQLRAMILRAIQTGDRAEQFLVARSARDRLRNPQQRDAFEDREGLMSMLGQIEEGFRDRSMDRQRSAATDALAKAQQLRRKAAERDRPVIPYVDPRTGETRIPFPRERS